MARPTNKRQRNRKLGTTGNPDNPSYYVTLPIALVRQLKWRDGQKLVVKKSRGRLVIEDWTEASK